MTAPKHDKARLILDKFFRDPLNNSHILDVSGCGIQAIPDEFEVLISENPSVAARLTHINLAHNALTTLPACLAQLPNLRILFLLKNHFTSIPPVVRQLSSLRMLSFKENSIEGMIDAATLPPNLTWLILTSNRITSLSEDFPFRCSKVRKLMLSNNLLTSLPPSFGKEMNVLELIRLSNNAFEEVPTDLLSCPKLAWLSLAGNPCAGGPVEASDLPCTLSVNLESEYQVDWGNPFGSGTSGSAFPGENLKDGTRVAVKKFSSLRGSDGRALDEVDISLAAAGVEGVVAAKGYSMTRNDDGSDEVALIMDLVPGNARTIAGPPSLESCTRSVYRDDLTFSTSDADRIFDVIEQAVEGLHTRGIAHGDIYGHNIITGEANESLVVKLGDLGAAWRFEEKHRDRVTTLERRALDIFREEVFSRVR